MRSSSFMFNCKQAEKKILREIINFSHLLESILLVLKWDSHF